MNKTDQAKSIAAKLSLLSRAKGVPYQNIATVFLLERLLARIIANPKLNKSLVFKGGYVGLRVYNSTRYTIDLDALLLKANVKSILIQTKLSIESDINDGTWFQLESQINLQTQGEYGGVRQTFRAGIGEKSTDIKRAQTINLDLGIGDPVTPEPVKIKTQELIGDGELSWLVYPIETIIAEKFHTLIVRGSENSRAKDVFDLFHYLPKADTKILKVAVQKCFEFRNSEMPSDPINFLKQMDLNLLKRGWKSASATIQNPPSFEKAFELILKELKNTYPIKRALK